MLSVGYSPACLKILRRRTLRVGLGLVLLAATSACTPRVCSFPEGALESVERVRGLEFQTPVQCQSLPANELEQRVRAIFEHQSDPARVAGEATAFRLAGFFSERYAYPDDVLRYYAGGLLALYSPPDRAVLMPSWKRHLRSRALYAHELTHAVQDDHFAVERLIDYTLSNDDMNARSALLEGDATWVARALDGVDPCVDNSAEALPSVLDLSARGNKQLPPALRIMFDFPYVYGFSLVCRIREAGGVELLNRAFAHPPRSASDVIRPTRYIERLQKASPGSGDLVVESLPVLDPAMPAECGADIRYEDRFGEILGALFLTKSFSLEDAMHRSVGWQNDRVTLSGDGDRSTLCWKIRFDAAESAAAFCDAAKTAFGVSSWSAEREGRVLSCSEGTAVLRLTSRR